VKRIASTPSTIPTAAIAGVRASLPKNVSMKMTIFSIAAAVRIGPPTVVPKIELKTQ
jgi:hypothetical protein